MTAMVSKANQEIVNAIDSRIGGFRFIYASLVVIFTMIVLLYMHSASEREKMGQEFIEYKAKIDLNTESRIETKLLAQSVEEFTRVVTRFMEETKKQNEDLVNRIDAGLNYQRGFYQEHKAVLEDAKRYINQNPIELLRKGK